jgi:putative membrane protein
VGDKRFRERRFLHTIGLLFLSFWLLMAANPVDRRDWLLENSLVFFLVALLAVTYRRYPLSNQSYVLIAIFLGLHEIGAHYVYDCVPLGFWVQRHFGTLRNDYDRMVHFSFGLLMTYPFRDAFLMTSRTTGFWSYFFPANIIMSLSAVYEIIEAQVAIVAHPGAGTAFLGMQGDMWDSQRDMLSALLGTAACSLIAFAANQIHLRQVRKKLELTGTLR